MKKIVVIGAGGHSKVVLDSIEQGKEFAVLGFIDSRREAGSSFLGYPVLGSLSAESLHQCDAGIVALGDNFQRKSYVDQALKIKTDFEFVSVIHPTAVVADSVEVGKGVFVAANAVINAYSKISDHSVVNTAACVEHDNQFAEFSSIGPNASTAGGVRVGKFSAICLGAAVRENINIGDNCVLGALSFLNNHLPSDVLAYGLPAKVAGERKLGEEYLVSAKI